MEFYDSFPSMMDFGTFIKEQQEWEAKCLRMDASELKKLDDGELCDAVRFRIQSKVFASESIRLIPEEMVFYVVDTLDMEVNNGGLCQFFVNFGPPLATAVSQCLSIIGAEEHRAIYEKFLSEHEIDVTDLSCFEIQDVSNYIQCAEKYPFEEFDDVYFTLPPVQECLIPYVRTNIEKF